MALASHCVCPVSTYKGKLSPELQQLLPWWSCASSFPGPGEAAGAAHTTGKGCREQEGAAVLSGALLVEDLFFPPKKDVGSLINCSVVTRLLLVAIRNGCSNQEWVVSS